MSTIEQNLRNDLGNGLQAGTTLGKYSTMRIGGPADYYFEARSIDELVQSVKSAKKKGVPVTILGGATNTLIADKGIRGLVVKNLTRGIHLRGMKGAMKLGTSSSIVYVEAESGVITNSLVRFAIEENLSGLEMHLGLPGTIGGAIYMNSKWTHPDGYVGDVVYQATILTPSGEVTVVPRAYFKFGYDSSIIQQSGDVVLSVVFALKKLEKEVLWKIAHDSMGYRRSSQPQGVASLGCTFQNISKAEALMLKTPNLTTSAGFLVDHAGLKGKQIGGAQISSMHANFIINVNQATAADVVELIELARRQVKEKFGVTLKEEIVRIGEF